METVRAFVRYQSITGRDPFDDFRMLEFNSKLLEAGVDSMPYFELLSEMANVLEFAKTNKSIDKYEQNLDLDFTEALTIIKVAYTSLTLGDAPAVKPGNEDLAAIIETSKELTPDDPLTRRLLEHQAKTKKNAVNILLSNVIQVGGTIESILPMEYEQAVNFINYRALVLQKQNKQQRENQRRG